MLIRTYSLANSPKARKMVLGGITLVVLIVGYFVFHSLNQKTINSPQSISLSKAIVRFSLQREKLINIRVPDNLRINSEDPVFAIDSVGEYHLVGWIEQRHGSIEANVAHESVIHWIDLRFSPSVGAIEYYETPDSLAWVAETLLPPEKRAAMMKSFVAQFGQFRDRLTADLEPLVVDSLRDILPIIQRRLQVALQNRQPQIEELALKYEETLVRGRIVPLIQKEVIPIVRKQSEPLLLEIGEELFARASVWRFTWRYLYDASPLPQRNLLQREFRRFVSQDAEPIITAHSEDILKVAKQITQELIINPAIKATSRDVASDLFRDPQLRQLIAEALAETFADPQPIRDAIRQRWESEQGQRFSNNLQDMLEPWMRDLGASLFGTPDSGLTRELVAVLRTQILAKDRHWLVVECGEATASTPFSSDMTMQRGKRLPIYPLINQLNTP